MQIETQSTQNLLLRKFTPDVYRYLFENYSEDDIRKELGIISDEEYLKEKEKYRQGYSSFNRSLVFFQLVYKANGEIIGGCGFHNWLTEHRKAELGYALTKDEYKGKGLMTEAVETVIAYGFGKMNLNRIEACIGPENIPSLKLVKKFGFKEEGYLRQHYFKDNVLQDSIIFSLLKEEYKGSREMQKAVKPEKE